MFATSGVLRLRLRMAAAATSFQDDGLEVFINEFPTTRLGCENTHGEANSLIACMQPSQYRSR